MENINGKKIIIAVVVYDRIGNFIKWCKLAKKIKEAYIQFSWKNIEIVIVHNTDNALLSANWKKISDRYPVIYKSRKNVGLDIGVLQDVKEDNFLGEYDFLMWFTDDCFPTSLTFLLEFLNPFIGNDKHGLTCFEVSKQIRPHARTTGFCIKKETLEKVVFPVQKIITKNHCYDFEHGQNNFYMQILKLGLEVKEVERDIFLNADSLRVKEFGIEKLEKEFFSLMYQNEKPDALIFATAYNRFPQIISSVLCQKHTHTKLEIWYDGIMNGQMERFYGNYMNMDDALIIKEVGEEAKGNYGHHLKKEFLETFDDSKSEYLLITNEDNYVSPYFIQKAIEQLEKHPDKIGAYCNGMIHNYKPDDSLGNNLSWRQRKNALVDGHIIDGYGLIPCRIEKGFIDISSIVFRSSVARAVNWGDFSHSSDWDYIENIAKAFGGIDKFIAFPGIHLVHN